VAISAAVESMSRLSACGQAATVGGGKIPLDLALTYQAKRQSNGTSGSSFFLQGGAVEFGAHLRHSPNVAASVSGGHVDAGTTGASPVDIVVFGARGILPVTASPLRQILLFFLSREVSI
jgi:hypothetical protein